MIYVPDVRRYVAAGMAMCCSLALLQVLAMMFSPHVAMHRAHHHDISSEELGSLDTFAVPPGSAQHFAAEDAQRRPRGPPVCGDHDDPTSSVSLAGASIRLESTAVRTATSCTVRPDVGHWKADCPCADGNTSTNELQLDIVVSSSLRNNRLHVHCVSGCSNTTELPIIQVGSSDAGRWRVTLTTSSCRDLREQIANATRTVEVVIDVRVCAAAAAQSAEMCFVSLGDWGGRTNPWHRVSAALTDFIVDRPEVRFLVSTGDNFYKIGVRNLTDPLWTDVFEKRLSHPVLQSMRFFVIAGNHDQPGLQPQLEYGATHPRWYFPERYYTVEIPLPRHFAWQAPPSERERSATGRDHVVANETVSRRDAQPLLVLFCLDTHGEDFKAQIVRLDRDLSSYASRPNTVRIVVGHVPVLSGSKHGQKKRSRFARQALLPVLVKHKVHAYLNGDDHILEAHRKLGVDFFVSGGGGGGGKAYPSKALPSTLYFSTKGRFGFMLHCLRLNDDSKATSVSSSTLTMRTSIIAVQGAADGSKGPTEVVFEVNTTISQ